MTEILPLFSFSMFPVVVAGVLVAIVLMAWVSRD